MSLSPEQVEQLLSQFATMQNTIQALQTRLHVAEENQAQAVLASNSSKGKELKVSCPEYFDGTPSKCRTFLLQLELIFLAKPTSFATDKAKVTFAATYLRGSAFSWFAPYLEQQDSILQDYDRFSQELSSMFGDPDRIASAERALMTLQQNNHPAFQYASDFRRIMVDTKWNENALAPIFYRGLRDDVKDELCKLDRPENLSKYMELAIKIDNRLFERRQEKRESNKSQSWIKKLPHQQNQPNKIQPNAVEYPPLKATNTGSTPMEISTTHRKLTSAEKESRIKKGLCLYCGNPGHLVSLCPLKPKLPHSKVFSTHNPEKNSMESLHIEQGNEQAQ